MSKGKGNGSLFRIRCRHGASADHTVQTRLTRTMGFVEISHLPRVSPSLGTSGDDTLDGEDAGAVSD